MPLTYDDREDLYIEIERLRQKCARLEGEVSYLQSLLNSRCVMSDEDRRLENFYCGGL